MGKSDLDLFAPVIVEWVDAVTDASVQYNSPQEAISAYKPCVRRTIGYLMGQTTDVVVVATDDDRSDQYPYACGGISYIPASIVRSVAPTKEAKLAKEK